MEDFNERYLHKFYGKYFAKVRDVNDPLQMGRVRVWIPEIHAVDTVTGETPTSGWALPSGGGGSQGGFFHMPKVGDWIWAECAMGDHEVLIWSHGPWTLFKGAGVPYSAKGKLDENANFNRNNEQVPETQFRGDYLKNTVWKEGGNKIEMDGTEGESRLNFEHETGSRVQFLDDGSLQQISSGVRRDVNYKGKTETTFGPTTETYEGTTQSTYNGGRRSEIDGEYEFIVIGGTTYRYLAPVTEDCFSRTTIIQTELVEEINQGKSVTTGGDISLGAGGSFTVLSSEKVSISALGANPSGLTSMDLTSTLRTHSTSPVFSFGIDPISQLPLTSVGAAGLALNALQSPVLKQLGFTAGLTTLLADLEVLLNVMIAAINVNSAKPPAGVVVPPIQPATLLGLYTSGTTAGGGDTSLNLFTT